MPRFIFRVPDELRKYLQCTACGLHKTRDKVVLGRGVIPADFCFIGLGPGRSEDMRGIAFCGESGRLIDDAINDAMIWAELKEKPSIFFTNLVACHPTDTFAGDNRDPSKSEFLACKNRFLKTIEIVKPKKIILLSDTVTEFLKKIYPLAISLYHPSFILRTGGVESAYYAAWYREIADIFLSLNTKPELLKFGGK